MRAISYPFKISPTGKVIATDDFGKMYLDRVLTLVSTIANQRFMRTSYGIDLKKALFENMDVFPSAMDSAIRQAVAIWIPEISIITLDISDPDIDGISKIEMYISLPNGEKKSFSFRTINIGPDGTTSFIGSY